MFFHDYAVYQFAFHEMFRDADECTEVVEGIGQLHLRVKTYLQTKEHRIHVVEHNRDPRHNRDETCRFKDEVSTEWTCAACKKNKHRSSSEHTLLRSRL